MFEVGTAMMDGSVGKSGVALVKTGAGWISGVPSGKSTFISVLVHYFQVLFKNLPVPIQNHQNEVYLWKFLFHPNAVRLLQM